LHRQVVAVEGAGQHCEPDAAPDAGLASADGEDFVAGLETGLGGDGVRQHAAHLGPHTVLADHQHTPVHGDREQEVEQRPRQHDQRALPQLLTIEGEVQLIRRDLFLALVEHLHIAAYRHGRERVLGRVAAAAPGQKRRAETDGKAQHLDAEPAGDPEVPEFVNGDQDKDRDQEGTDGDGEVVHAVRTDRG
jgi:hypothetical protein